MNIKTVKCLLLGFALAFSSVGAMDTCQISNDVFRADEHLEYQLFYNVSFVWIQAGTCQFNVRKITYNQKPVFRLSVEGKSDRSFDAFYKVRDTLISYVDPETLIPIRAYKYAHEDKWHGVDDFSFRKDGNRWRVATRLMRKKAWKPMTISYTQNCGFDILTSIYRMRCLASPEFYKPGKKQELYVRLDDGEYHLSLTYVGKEKIKLHNVGYYNAHAFTITLVEGKVFKRGDVLKLWISDDKNRIPLLIESPIRVGTVKAILKTAEKTAYPLQQPTVK